MRIVKSGKVLSLVTESIEETKALDSFIGTPPSIHFQIHSISEVEGMMVLQLVSTDQ